MGVNGFCMVKREDDRFGYAGRGRLFLSGPAGRTMVKTVPL